MRFVSELLRDLMMPLYKNATCVACLISSKPTLPATGGTPARSVGGESSNA